jgi:predicted AAA+ superfamily ATPase
MVEYVERLVDAALDELLSELPAVMLTGPRAAGKTTTALRHAESVVRLDRANEAEAFREDPDAALRGLPRPVLLDEWQAVPGVLGAVKRAVDADSAPAGFILTGSARAEGASANWPATGRIVRLPVFPLTEREIRGRLIGESFADRLAHPSVENLGPANDFEAPDVATYVDLALRGGFPQPTLRLSARTRRAWLGGYLEELVTADAQGLDHGRDPVKMRRYLDALAISTAGVPDDKKLADAADIDGRTARSYRDLLQGLFVLDRVPAWSSNRVSRLTQMAKNYIVDPSLVGAAARLDRNGVLLDGAMLGRVVDTFVAAQIRPELALSLTRPRLFHLRDKGGRHEVDLVLEYADGRIAAIEVKSGSVTTGGAARHIAWLRDQVGSRFLCGVILHSGPQAFQVDPTIFAAPISTLWA